MILYVRTERSKRCAVTAVLVKREIPITLCARSHKFVVPQSANVLFARDPTANINKLGKYVISTPRLYYYACTLYYYRFRGRKNNARVGSSGGCSSSAATHDLVREICSAASGHDDVRRRQSESSSGGRRTRRGRTCHTGGFINCPLSRMLGRTAERAKGFAKCLRRARYFYATTVSRAVLRTANRRAACAFIRIHTASVASTRDINNNYNSAMI